MKTGDKVMILNLKGIPESFRKKLSKRKKYTVNEIKPSGGVILLEVDHPINLFGERQGLVQSRLKVVQYAKKNIIKKWKIKTTQKK